LTRRAVFCYPDDWNLEIEQADNRLEAHGAESGTAFALIQFDRDAEPEN